MLTRKEDREVRRRAVKAIVKMFIEKHSIKKLDRPEFERICKAENIELVANFIGNKDREFWAQSKYDGIRGWCLKHRPTGMHIIWLRCLLEGTWDCYTAAHELGHAVMDHSGRLRQQMALFNDETKLGAYRASLSRHEFEADEFAKELIVRIEVIQDGEPEQLATEETTEKGDN